MEYHPDGKTLFLGTRLSGKIECYSLPDRKTSKGTLLDIDERTPSRIAVSCTGKLMVVAYERPTAVQVKRLLTGHDATKFKPNVSSSSVEFLAFHPQREGIFLLLFTDGLLASYDASGLLDYADDATKSDQQSKLVKEHAIPVDYHVDKEQGSYPILSVKFAQSRSNVIIAAFVPGVNLKVITITREGLCRVIDLTNDKSTGRTWQINRQVTALSLLAISSPLNEVSLVGTSLKHSKARPNDSHLVAVGTMDGKVLLYDYLGCLLKELSIPNSEKVISLGWNPGIAPRSIAGTGSLSRRSKRYSTGSMPIPKVSVDRGNNNVPVSDPEVVTTVVHQPRVNHNRSMKIASPHTGRFEDLFSVQKVSFQGANAQSRAVIGPGKAPLRPRITSSTFIDITEPMEKQYAVSSASSVISVPTELDPNITLSYLTTTKQDSRFYEHLGRDDFDDAMILPDYMLSSSSSTTSLFSPMHTDTLRLSRSSNKSRLLEMTSPTSQCLSSTEVAKSSPAKLRRRSQQRTSFISYMNRTAATDNRRRKARTVKELPTNNATFVKTAKDMDEVGLQGKQATERSRVERDHQVMPAMSGNVVSLQHTIMNDLLPNVPRKDSLKQPAKPLHADTLFFDTATYPQSRTRSKSKLLESLRVGRAKTLRLATSDYRNARYVQDRHSEDSLNQVRPTVIQTAKLAGRIDNYHTTKANPDDKVQIMDKLDARTRKAFKRHGTVLRPMPGQYPLSLSDDATSSTPQEFVTPSSCLDGKTRPASRSSLIRRNYPRGSSLIDATTNQKKQTKRSKYGKESRTAHQLDGASGSKMNRMTDMEMIPARQSIGHSDGDVGVSTSADQLTLVSNVDIYSKEANLSTKAANTLLPGQDGEVIMNVEPSTPVDQKGERMRR